MGFRDLLSQPPDAGDNVISESGWRCFGKRESLGTGSPLLSIFEPYKCPGSDFGVVYIS